jgi:hypothetical protein
MVVAAAAIRPIATSDSALVYVRSSRKRRGAVGSFPSKAGASRAVCILPGVLKHLRGRGGRGALRHFEEAGGVEETTPTRSLIAGDHTVEGEGPRIKRPDMDDLRVVA